MKIHMVAALPHYRRHVHAIWKHLPDDLRGEEFTQPDVVFNPRASEDLVMVGGFWDIDRVPNNRVIYVEHGAGQSYRGDPSGDISRHPSYHGSHHPDRVVAYCAPREDVAESWRERGREAFVVGCPALDEWMGVESPPRTTIAWTWHHNFMLARICPEMGTARLHYDDEMPALVRALQSQGFEILGHGHPRDTKASYRWNHWGAEYVADVDELLARAGGLIADNTSLLYEFAALDRPVMALNCPEYRSDVHHGLRFWDYVPGWQADGPDDIIAGAPFVFGDNDIGVIHRIRCVGAGMAYDSGFDGFDGPRAASALTAWARAL